MPTKSPKASKPKARSKAKAALAEAEPQEKTYEWRGLTLTLPADPPGDLLFAAEEFGDRPTGMVNAFVGASQYQAIRAKITADGLSLKEAFEEIASLADGLTELYGLGRGESSASQDS
jgi:hypothetical protein